MLPQMKGAIAIADGSSSAGYTLTSSVIDTLGYDFAMIDVWGTSQTASTQAGSPLILKLQEADVTNATSFGDITGFRGGSATATNVDFVVGIGVTTAANAYKFNVDCRTRKRYLSVVLQGRSDQTWFGYVNLARGEQSPSTATKAGVISLIEG